MISHPSESQRESVHLWIAISILIVLSAYRLASALAAHVKTFFDSYTELPVAELLTNMLFFWLLALLLLAYRRWHGAILRRNELENVLTSISPDSIAVINIDRVITMCSGQVESMFGYTYKELLGKSTDALYYDRRLRGERGEIANRLEKYGFHVGYATGKRRNGDSFPLEIITGTFAGQEGAVLLMRDITERRNTEEALLKSEERFELFMRYLPGYAFVKDADGRHVYLNTKYERAYGWTIADCLGKTDFELFPQALAEQFSDGDKRVLEESHDRRYVTRVEQQDGVHSLLTCKFPIPVQGNGRPMIGGISLDITEQEKAESDRRNIEKQMQQAQKLESLGVLGGGIAHDFNNLLMGMLGHADLALTQLPASGPARQNIEEVVASAQRAADLANQLLAYSGEGKFIVEALSLSHLVEEMSNLFEVSVSKKAALHFDLSQQVSAIRCDTTQIQQVIMNLVVNASDALNGESGEITISTGELKLTEADFKDTYLGTTMPDGPYVFVQVRDTGSGMDEATCARIFDPFFTTKFAGRGLGLAAVIGIVRSHNGAISVDSAEGEGTTFTVHLPAVDAQPKEKVAPITTVDDWRGSGMLLVADDEETVRKVAKMMLENIGFEVMTVENGREAVNMVKEFPERFTAILLDLTMPELGGFEAYQEIRQTNAKIPVVLSSGYNKQDEVEDLHDPYPPVFLKKPYRIDSIRAVFKSILS
jgi:two-component system, cell cycle sensor histidine kinase and response regulator CckA